MRLKELYIKNYKNLIDFKLNFESGEGLSILIGNNGSGKSNVLEALSGIFSNAYSQKVIHKFVYSLTYIIRGKEVKLTQNEYKCLYYVDKKLISIKELNNENLLPTNVIAIYSGEDKRLWHNFYEMFYLKFTQSVINNKHNIQSQKMYYINKYYWDIALLTLIFSTAEDDEKFLQNILGRDSVDHILLFYAKDDICNCKSELLKAFLETVNLLSENKKTSDGKSTYLYAMTKEEIFDQYGIQIFDGFAAVKKHYLFVDAKFLNNKPDSFNYYEKQLFDYFVQAYMPKEEKILNNIELIYNGFSAKELSEGEKKLILLRAVLSFVADENSLILLDEPDANIHEGRKQDLYKLFYKYSKYHRQIVLATHSPIMAQLAKEKELIMLEFEEERSIVISEEKIEKIKKLSGNSWDIIGQGMILNSQKPLVIFEGKTDVMYVKRALEKLKNKDSRYEEISVDFLNANGAGNVKSFLQNLEEVVPKTKRIIIFFDRDNAGKDGAKAITGISKDDQRIAHYQDIKKGNITVSFIPYKSGINEGDFLIEDYFSWDNTISPLIKSILSKQQHPVKNLPNLSDRIKKEIESHYYEFNDSEFNGFVPLLDKILDLSKKESS